MAEEQPPPSLLRNVSNMVFKPVSPHLRLPPAETQLLLAYIGEILKEIEAEENQKGEEEGALCK